MIVRDPDEWQQADLLHLAIASMVAGRVDVVRSRVSRSLLVHGHGVSWGLDLALISSRQMERVRSVVRTAVMSRVFVRWSMS